MGECFDRVGKGKLLVIVCMHTNVFAVFFSKFGVFICNRTDLFRVKSTVTVHDINAIGAALTDHFKCLVNIGFFGIGDCHDITGYLVALCLGIFNHFDCSRHLVHVSCHTNHVNYTVFFVNDIFFVIAASDICHDGNLHIGVVVTNDLTDGFLITELPLAEFIYVKQLLGSFITKLHIVNAGLYIGAVECVDKVIGEHKVVYESSVTNGCVQYTNIGTCCH